MNALPVELVFEIIAFSSYEDQKSLSLVSESFRKEALHFIFQHLRYSGHISAQIRNMHQARKDVKEAVRTLELHSRISTPFYNNQDDYIIFEFSETLPNLHTWRYYDIRLFSLATDLFRLISSVRHNSLRELCLLIRQPLNVEGPPLTGPPGLQKLSITWETSNDTSTACAQLYELIRPSLTTLVELQIDSTSEELAHFDLHLLKPAANTLRIFFFGPQRAGERIFRDIPDVFPNVTHLAIMLKDPQSSALWKGTLIDGLCKIRNLEDLVLSSDLEVQTGDIMRADRDFAWYVRCYERRLQATREVASRCKTLLRCTWLQVGINHMGSIMTHPFIVEETRSACNAETTRVVRGVKQSWMGQDQHDWITGGVVSCKIEDLPGDIVP